MAALEQFCHCGTLTSIVVAADSMCNLRLAAEDEILGVLQGTAIGRRAALLFDGSSQSGLESIARIALLRRNVRLQSQVRIDGVGRVDLLIGERLVLELDGKQWHVGAGYEEDRRRDLALVSLGYLVVRVAYRQVIENWREVEHQLLTIIRQREHLRTPSGRKVGDRR
ncbi:MAG TPA: DUF559 domain-containing protein [Pseudolysinimonas sp.]|nr:DUF559 domain-containing protein [Pseudolysinimonas sp.]